MKIIKWPKWYIALSILFVIFFFIFNDKSSSKIRKEKFNRDLTLHFRSIVVDKFIDHENHEYKTCYLLENSDTSIWLMNFDRSGLFNYIIVGDSIIKNSGDSIIYVKRNDNLKKFVLDY